MSTLLDDALAGLGLEPGQTYTTTVGGCEYEIHAREKAALVKPMEEPTTSKPADEEPSQFADMVMLEPWFETPPPTKVGTVIAKLGNWPLMDPVVIDEWDQTPE